MKAKITKKVIQYVYDRSKQTNLGMTYLLPFFNLACSAETQIKENKKNKTKHKLATSQIHTYPKYLFLPHPHTHTQNRHIYTQTQTKQVIFKGITHLITTCARALYKERERKRKFIVVILKGYGGASEDIDKV